MAKELKGLTYEQVQAKVQEAEKALAAMQTAGVSVPSIEETLKKTIEDGNAELASRVGEQTAVMVAPGIVKSIEKDYKGKSIDKEVTLALRIFTNEEGVVTAEVKAHAKKSSGGSSSTGGGSGRGGARMGAKVTMPDGRTFEGPSAANVLDQLKEAGLIKQELGESDSAVRVLKSLKTKEIISSFEQVELAKEEAPAADAQA